MCGLLTRDELAKFDVTRTSDSLLPDETQKSPDLAGSVLK